MLRTLSLGHKVKGQSGDAGAAPLGLHVPRRGVLVRGGERERGLGGVEEAMDVQVSIELLPQDVKLLLREGGRHASRWLTGG